MKKNTTGSIILFGSLLLYILYWVVLLNPIQAKYASTGNYPSIVGCIIAAIVAGLIAATGTYVGNGLKKDKAFGIEHTSFTWRQLFKSKAFYGWVAVWVILTMLFTHFWRNDL